MTIDVTNICWFFGTSRGKSTQIRARFIGARACAIPRHRCAIIPRRDDSHNAYPFFFSRARFTLFRVHLWTLKQLRARDPRSPWPEEEIEKQGCSGSLENFFTATMAYADFKKRSNEDLPSLSHLSAGRPKTYDKYLMGVILLGGPPATVGPLRRAPLWYPRYCRGVESVYK